MNEDKVQRLVRQILALQKELAPFVMDFANEDEAEVAMGFAFLAVVREAGETGIAMTLLDRYRDKTPLNLKPPLGYIPAYTDLPSCAISVSLVALTKEEWGSGSHYADLLFHKRGRKHDVILTWKDEKVTVVQAWNDYIDWESE